MWKKLNQYFPQQEEENKWCSCGVGFSDTAGLAQGQNSLPRRGSSSQVLHEEQAFKFTAAFSPSGVSTLLIKAETRGWKDGQASFPSCLRNPWPSWCVQKHVEGFRFHVQWYGRDHQGSQELPTLQSSPLGKYQLMYECICEREGTENHPK